MSGAAVTPKGAVRAPIGAQELLWESGRKRLSELVFDRSLQPRERLSQRNVARLSERIEAHTELDPIRVADVAGRLLVIDGWHRAEALRRCSGELSDELIDIDCLIAPMTLEEAARAALDANEKHGEPLKKADNKRRFLVFMAGKGHLQGARYRSYRDIGARLQIPFKTVERWMKSHFPKVASAMSKGGGYQHEPLSRGGRTPRSPADKLDKPLRDIAGIWRDATEEQRKEMADLLQQRITDLLAGGPVESKDF